jgi:hypothetical protein
VLVRARTYGDRPRAMPPACLARASQQRAESNLSLGHVTRRKR